MSWAVGYDENWKRDVGYGVPTECDHPGCHARIDRGLSYVCGSEPFGGERGCGLYFCAEHHKTRVYRNGAAVDLCARCWKHESPFAPKPDLPEWLHHKQTDPSWEAWRLARERER